MDLDAVRRGAEAPVLADARTASSAAADLAAAFVDYPIFNWFMRTDGKRDAARGRMFELLVREMALPLSLIHI